MDESTLGAVEALLNEEFNGGASGTEATVETPQASQTILDARGNAHGPDGKFVPQAADSAEPAIPADAGIEEEAEGEEAPAEAEGEPQAAEEGEESPEEGAEEAILELDLDHPFFAKYGGDVEKAFKALEEAQSKIGQQGNELGQSRSELQELKTQLEQLQNMIQLQQQAAGVDWETMIDENPEQAIFAAAELQNPVALEAAFRALYAEDPFKATQVQTYLQQQQMAQAPPAPQADLASEMSRLNEKYPDIKERVQDIENVLAEKPYLANALQEGDPRTRAQALEDAYLLARSRTSESDTSAKAKVILKAARESADAAKADAAVLSASKSSAAEVGPAPNEKLQQALRDFSGLDDLIIV